MVGMREDSVYIRGVWVAFGHKRINEVLQLKELKHGLRFKKLVENPDHGKIIDLLTTGYECLKHSYCTRVRFMFLVDFTFK